MYEFLPDNDVLEVMLWCINKFGLEDSARDKYSLRTLTTSTDPDICSGE